MEKKSHQKNISSNQLFSNFFSKNVAFTKFLPKNVRKNFCNFHSVFFTVWKNEKFTVTNKKFRQINSLVLSLVKTLLSRNFCQISVTVNFHNFHNVVYKSWFFTWNQLFKKFREINFTEFRDEILWIALNVLEIQYHVKSTW